jgi:hypothetical protein
MEKPTLDSLNWEVETQKLYNANGKALRDYRLLVRDDTNSVLNVCKKSYKPTLNATFKDVVNQMRRVTGFELDGFVEGYGGRKLFAYLKSERNKMAGFDFDNYMVIGNSHDYSSGFFLATTHTMIRCENQWSNVKKNQLYSIPHTSASEERIEALVARFEVFMEDLNKTKRELELWKQIDVDQTLREMMIQRILNIELGEEDCPPRKKAKMEILTSSIETEMADIGENLLGLFQGVTHYTTHRLEQKNRVFGNMNGNSLNINNKAIGFCQAMADGLIENIDLN